MSQYDVYLRQSNGKRGAIVDGIVSIEATFRFNQPVKWTITGASLEECPISNGAEIVVFRNGQVLFCGYSEKKADRYDAMSRIYDWEISGQSDLGKLVRRLVFPNPSVVPPNPDKSYSATGVLSTILLNMIDLNAGSNAGYPSRGLPNLVISTQTPVGDSETIDSKIDQLLRIVQSELVDTDIQIKESWDLETGKWDIKIFEAEDVSDKVIFSVDNGTISSWERTVAEPKGNYLVVTGGEGQDGNTMFCSVIDWGSINTWGSIELIVNRSDIKRNEEENESWASVAARLEAAAYEELEKASARFGYKLETTEINRNVYKEDYDIGSIVSVRIADEEFTAKVDEIKITYEQGIETITPSIGTMQKGELQSVFNEIGTLKEQVKVLQKSI